MMNKFRLLLLASSLFVLNGIGHAQTSTMSLNSSNPKIVWEVKPQADLNNICLLYTSLHTRMKPTVMN